VRSANNINPIVAVVPNNEDPNLMRDETDHKFWDRVRSWQNRGWQIALHGYNHVYTTNNTGIVPFNNFSEFAGVDEDIQKDKIKKGIEMFNKK
jgi:predicted deacetylase